VHVNPPPFQRVLYGSVESGFPAIICFHTAGDTYHAVPVLGHTFDEDAWVPSAQRCYLRVGADTSYVPSDAWLNSFIIHDDNLGSKFSVSRYFLNQGQTCERLPGGPGLCGKAVEGVAYVIATLPKSVCLNSIEAEVAGADFLFTILPRLGSASGDWTRRLASHARNGLLVLRPLLVNARSYARHLASVRGWDHAKLDGRLIAEIARMETGWLWMVELSVPELFSANRRKVGEVLIRAEENPRGQRDFNLFAFARLPGCFVLYARGAPSRPEYWFLRSGVDSPVELYGCEESAKLTRLEG
jgi:hypothetical protein